MVRIDLARACGRPRSGRSRRRRGQPTLTIYTYDAFAADYGPGPGLKAGFEKTCGCTVDFVATDSSIGALRRVQLEGATTSADIVLGLDTSLTGEARATGLFAPHGLSFDKLALPAPWTDADFAPVDFGYFAFVYDKTQGRQPADLVRGADRRAAELQDRARGPALRHARPRPRALDQGRLWRSRRRKSGAGLKPHIVTMARGWSEAYGLFLKGEADMALSYTTSPAYHAVAENDPNYAYAEFTEGFYPQIESRRHPQILAAPGPGEAIPRLAGDARTRRRSSRRPTGCTRWSTSATTCPRPSRRRRPRC